MSVSDLVLFERKQITPGTKVKTWDFEPIEGRSDCFVIGTVTENNGDFLTVHVEEDSMCQEGFRLDIQTPLYLYTRDFPERIEILN